MKYYQLSNGDGRYIRRDGTTGKYVPIAGSEKGDTWQKYSTVYNVLNSMLPKSYRKCFHIVEKENNSGVEGGDKLAAKDGVDQVFESDIHDADDSLYARSKNDIRNTILELSRDVADSSELDELKDNMMMFLNIFSNPSELHDKYTARLSDIDREIVDIEHYIELNGLDAYHGWLAYRALHNKLCKRRYIKDSIFIISQFKCNADDNLCNSLLKIFQNMNKRKYSPRMISGLFEGQNTDA